MSADIAPREEWKWNKGRLNRRPNISTWNFIGDPPAGFTFFKDQDGQMLVLPVITIDPNGADPLSPNRSTLYTSGGTEIMSVVTDGDAQGISALLGILSRGQKFNLTNWDRDVNNTEATVFTSAARTATTNSADQTNFGAKGVRLILDITAVSGTSPTLDVKLQSKDIVSAKYIDIPSAAFAQKTATGTDDLVVYPGVVASANRSLSQTISRTWRVVATIGGTTPSFTFSLGAHYTL